MRNLSILILLLAGCGDDGSSTPAADAARFDGPAVAFDAPPANPADAAPPGPDAAIPPDAAALPSTVLAEHANSIVGLTLDGEYLYYGSQHTLYRVRTDGTAAAETLETGLTFVGDVAVDDTYIYTSASTGPSGVDITARPKAGGPRTTILAGTNGGWPIAADGTFIYVCESGSIRRVPRLGGAATTIATGGCTTPLVIWNGNLVYAGGGDINAIPLDGSPATTIPTGTVNVTSFWVDDLGITVENIQPFPHTLDRTPFGGASFTLATLDNTLRGLVSDGTTVYYGTGTGGDITLYQIPATGGIAAPFTTTVYHSPWQLTLDPTSLYFVTIAPYQIHKLPR